MENNIDRAIEYGQELKGEVGENLPASAKQDLEFTVATAHSLKSEDLDLAIDLYNESLKTNTEMRGIINNNLGMCHFFKFIQLSKKAKEMNQFEVNSELGRQIIDSAKNAVRCLKLSVV